MKITIPREKNNSKQIIQEYIYYVHGIQYSFTQILVNNLESQFRVKMHLISVSVKLATYGVLVKMDKNVQ